MSPVTGLNFVVCSYGKFQPGYRDEKESKRARNVDWGPGNEFEREIQESKQRWRHVQQLYRSLPS